VRKVRPPGALLVLDVGGLGPLKGAAVVSASAAAVPAGWQVMRFVPIFMSVGNAPPSS
jgi:hypothetical protein